MTEPRRYAVWAGNPRGVKEDPARCVEELFTTAGPIIGYQCRHNRGHGEEGRYCTLHARKATPDKPLFVQYTRDHKRYKRG